MPFGDRTGPRGMGPMTGRGAGHCRGYGMPGYMNPGPGGGYGFGFRGAGRGGFPWGGGRGYAWGGGRGPGWWGGYPNVVPYNPPVTKDQEIEALKAQADYFKDALDDINKRLNDLTKSDE